MMSSTSMLLWKSELSNLFCLGYCIRCSTCEFLSLCLSLDSQLLYFRGLWGRRVELASGVATYAIHAALVVEHFVMYTSCSKRDYSTVLRTIRIKEHGGRLPANEIFTRPRVELHGACASTYTA